MKPEYKHISTDVFNVDDDMLVGYASGRWMRYTSIPLTVHNWMVGHPKQVKYIDLPLSKGVQK